MAYKYTVEQKAQALILLAANRGDANLTSSQTGISAVQLKKWATQEQQLPSPDIGKGMEQAIHYLMGQIPNLVNKYNIAELLGTLLEKWLHYQGIPQNSTQTILAVLATKTDLQLDAMIRDIELGKQLQLNDRQQIIDVERELANQGLIGIENRPVKPPESPAELIEYSVPEINDDQNTGSKDW